MKNRRWIGAAALAIGMVPFGVVIGENLFLNLALSSMLDQQPERLRIDYALAWMVIPGHVHVYGLQIRTQGLGDQWAITADRAEGQIGLRALWDGEFRAWGIRGHGVTVHCRSRIPSDASAEEILAHVDDPPVLGLSNPPDPDPESIYPKRGKKWNIILDDVQIDGLREVWIGSYRLRGDASLAADIAISGPFLDLNASVAFGGMRADMGDAELARDIVGTGTIRIEGIDRKDLPDEKFSAISGELRVAAEVQDLRFLDFYLSAAPWLSLEGSGQMDIDLALENGAITVGSVVEAAFPELLVRVLGNDVTGAGLVRAEVVAGEEGAPESLISVAFDDFAITPDGSTAALIEGTGFRVEARSDDVSLDRPFASVDVVVNLPPSTIPDVRPYNLFLPTGIGLELVSGTGTIEGELVAASNGAHASGALRVTGDDVRMRYDTKTITGDLALQANLGEARLDEGWYDLSGTRLDLMRLGIVDREDEDPDRTRAWKASVALPSGWVQVGAPVYLSTDVVLEASDSVPFVTLFADRGSLPGWLQKVISVSDVQGRARLSLGRDTIEVNPAALSGGALRLDLRFLRQGRTTAGTLLARAGPLSLGIELGPQAGGVQVFGSKKWFENGANPGQNDAPDSHSDEKKERRNE